MVDIETIYEGTASGCNAMAVIRSFEQMLKLVASLA